MSTTTEPTTAGAALAAAERELAAAGVPTPRLDAQILLEYACGAGRAELIADPERPLSPPERERFATWIGRRAAREPVAYITGTRGFHAIELRCDRRALIPRPETELLVELALEIAPARVIDVGTGTGAIALAVAAALPRAEVLALDTSASALELAAENADALGLGDRVGFELRTAAATDEAELVLANLPYVRDDEWPGLEPEIREYEPREALLAGADGLDAIRALLDSPPRCRAIALEHGAGQAQAVAELLTAAGFTGVEHHRDLAGIERVVSGAR